MKDDMNIAVNNALANTIRVLDIRGDMVRGESLNGFHSIIIIVLDEPHKDCLLGGRIARLIISGSKDSTIYADYDNEWLVHPDIISIQSLVASIARAIDGVYPRENRIDEQQEEDGRTYDRLHHGFNEIGLTDH